ncbi:hypothetical protein BDA99DRAFT_317350 [Phascolomyces articulosus]|uniref:Zn(2)-C6 fungal-type domain-containing protein n=1 Tax=Phascolomyces articulosus TaxID=60185 RepID=A0AAD5JKE5_9FUNG|nr:hypothetical protein BDA99DRAFT_317350 [Phascolomyces articulosus]
MDLSRMKPVCHACRKRQRGCIWPVNTATTTPTTAIEACLRCTKLNIQCIVSEEHSTHPGNDDDVLPKEFTSKSINYWQHQLAQLENDMQQMELDTHSLLKTKYHDTNKYIENHAMVTMSSGKGVKISNRQQQQFEWNITIKENGLLKLHTRINTIEELLEYSHAFVKYLSPFGKVFRKSWINVESTSQRLILNIYVAVFLMNKAKEEQKIKTSATLFISMIGNLKEPASLSPYLHMHYQSIIDHLIHAYVQHPSSRLLFLHISTFMEYYQNLRDPLTCPITLAICIHMLCTARRIITHSATERREIADFFYEKCKDILYDIFDDPTYKLETILVINLLQYFIMFVLLRFSEAHRWATIAYTLCKELEQGDDNANEQFEQQHQQEQKWSTISFPPEIRRVLLQRHFSYSENTLSLLDIMVEGKIFQSDSARLGMEAMFMEHMKGEDTASYNLVEVHNRLLQLCSSPYMKAITTHVDELYSNTSQGVSMDILVQLDNTIQNWWDELPSRLRLCDSLYAKDAKDLAERNNSIPKAIVFAFVHSILFKIYACVLEMKSSLLDIQDDGDGDDQNIIHSERILLCRRAMSNATEQSYELLLSTIRQIFSLHQDILPFMFEFISRVICTTKTASLLPKKYGISPILREKAVECFETMLDVFPPDNIVPGSKSPINMYLKTYSLGDVGVYQEYPLPGLAVLADVVGAGIFYVKSDLFQSSQEPLYTNLRTFTYSILYGNFCFIE